MRSDTMPPVMRLSGIVVNVSTRFLKAVYRSDIALLLQCSTDFGQFFSTHSSCITHQPLSDNTGGSLSDYMQLPLEPQKALYYFFFFHNCSSTPQDL